MAHSLVIEAEKILDKKYKVLNKGFVRLVDYMGSDDRIVQAARVSYGAGTKTYREDQGLIDYLLRNDHTSPFEQVVFTFHLKMPIFVARQWIRHRTARVNEISGRYSVMKDEFYIPDAGDVSFQSDDNKQGRSTEKVPAAIVKQVRELFALEQKAIYANYEQILSKNIARELARINLPLSMYTEMYWQIDLHNLFHFLKLRIDAHAQKEIRAFAVVMHTIGSTVCPKAFASFDNHILNGQHFSGSEMKTVRAMIEGKQVGLDSRALERLKQKIGI